MLKAKRKKAFGTIAVTVIILAVALLCVTFFRSFMNDSSANMGKASSAQTDITENAINSASTPSYAGNSSDWTD